MGRRRRGRGKPSKRPSPPKDSSESAPSSNPPCDTATEQTCPTPGPSTSAPSIAFSASLRPQGTPQEKSPSSAKHIPNLAQLATMALSSKGVIQHFLSDLAKKASKRSPFFVVRPPPGSRKSEEPALPVATEDTLASKMADITISTSDTSGKRASTPTNLQGPATADNSTSSPLADTQGRQSSKCEQSAEAESQNRPSRTVSFDCPPELTSAYPELMVHRESSGLQPEQMHPITVPKDSHLDPHDYVLTHHDMYVFDAEDDSAGYEHESYWGAEGENKDQQGLQFLGDYECESADEQPALELQFLGDADDESIDQQGEGLAQKPSTFRGHKADPAAKSKMWPGQSKRKGKKSVSRTRTVPIEKEQETSRPEEDFAKDVFKHVGIALRGIIQPEVSLGHRGLRRAAPECLTVCEGKDFYIEPLRSDVRLESYYHSVCSEGPPRFDVPEMIPESHKSDVCTEPAPVQKRTGPRDSTLSTKPLPHERKSNEKSVQVSKRKPRTLEEYLNSLPQRSHIKSPYQHNILDSGWPYPDYLWTPYPIEAEMLEPDLLSRVTALPFQREKGRVPLDDQTPTCPITTTVQKYCDCLVPLLVGIRTKELRAGRKFTPLDASTVKHALHDVYQNMISRDPICDCRIKRPKGKKTRPPSLALSSEWDKYDYVSDDYTEDQLNADVLDFIVEMIIGFTHLLLYVTRTVVDADLISEFYHYCDIVGMNMIAQSESAVRGGTCRSCDRPVRSVAYPKCATMKPPMRHRCPLPRAYKGADPSLLRHMKNVPQHCIFERYKGPCALITHSYHYTGVGEYCPLRKFYEDVMMVIQSWGERWSKHPSDHKSTALDTLAWAVDKVLASDLSNLNETLRNEVPARRGSAHSNASVRGSRSSQFARYSRTTIDPLVSPQTPIWVRRAARLRLTFQEQWFREFCRICMDTYFNSKRLRNLLGLLNGELLTIVIDKWTDTPKFRRCRRRRSSSVPGTPSMSRAGSFLELPRRSSRRSSGKRGSDASVGAAEMQAYGWGLADEQEKQVQSPAVKRRSTVGPDITVDRDVVLTGDIALIGNVLVRGNVKVKGNISVEGHVVVEGDFKVEGKVSVKGDLSVKGNIAVRSKRWRKLIGRKRRSKNSMYLAIPDGIFTLTKPENTEPVESSQGPSSVGASEGRDQAGPVPVPQSPSRPPRDLFSAERSPSEDLSREERNTYKDCISF